MEPRSLTRAWDRAIRGWRTAPSPHVDFPHARPHSRTDAERRPRRSAGRLAPQLACPRGADRQRPRRRGASRRTRGGRQRLARRHRSGTRRPRERGAGRHGPPRQEGRAERQDHRDRDRARLPGRTDVPGRQALAQRHRPHGRVRVRALHAAHRRAAGTPAGGGLDTRRRAGPRHADAPRCRARAARRGARRRVPDRRRTRSRRVHAPPLLWRQPRARDGGRPRSRRRLGRPDAPHGDDRHNQRAHLPRVARPSRVPGAGPARRLRSPRPLGGILPLGIRVRIG